ncbi:MAG: septum formation initiator family protein, partial [Acidimicrobiia bacterium]|nr:septum formation initiator family protein [Acidimicrobiia bacterium]
LSRVEEQVAVLGEQNRLLEERARLLRDDAEIERLAREEYHLVRPGEEAYVVLPGPDRAPPPEQLPPPLPRTRRRTTATRSSGPGTGSRTVSEG